MARDSRFDHALLIRTERPFPALATCTFSGCGFHVVGLWHHPQDLSSCQPEYFARTIISGPFCVEKLVWKLTEHRKERLVYWNANTWWHILRGSALGHCCGFFIVKVQIANMKNTNLINVAQSYDCCKLLYVGMCMDHE